MLSLPSEVILQIFSIVCSINTHTGVDSTRSPLVCLQLICRQLLGPARALAFRRVAIFASTGNRFSRLLQQHPGIGESVQDLSFWAEYEARPATSAQIRCILPLCVNTTRLAVAFEGEDISPAQLLTYLPKSKLRDLTMRHTSARGSFALLPLASLQGFDLQVLALRDIRLVRIGGAAASPVNIHQCHLTSNAAANRYTLPEQNSFLHLTKLQTNT